MNKKSKTLIWALSSVLLVACGGGSNGNNSNNNDNKTHTHAFDGDYKKDQNFHWKECTVDGCDAIDEDSKAAHDYDEGTITKLPVSCKEPGEGKFVCKICGYELTNSVTTNNIHVYDSSKWEKDQTGHWNPTTCGHDAKGNFSSHAYGDWSITKAATESEAGEKQRVCSTCGFVETQVIPKVVPVSERFSFNNDITVAQKIHTQNQENFLKYSGEYYSITSSELNSFDATGSKEVSFPNQVTLTWNHTPAEGKTIKNYSVITGQKADLSDGYMITGTTNKTISFYNAFLGTNYFRVVATYTDTTNELSEIKTFLVDATAPRNLKVGTMSNCRDMGGRTTTAGGKIKQGLVYRTSDPANSGVGDVSEWTKRMGIKTEIYVKDDASNSKKSSPLGSSVKFVNASMDYGATPYSNLSRNAERVRKVFDALGDENNYPVMYHCRIGTDRTGICGILINGLIGVSFNETIQDYSFSNFGKIDNQRYVGKTPDNNGDDIAKYIEDILAMPGETFQEKVVYTLLSIGVPAQTLQNVIDIMTEGTKVTIPTNITVANGDALTNNGGSKKTANDFTAPDTYYEISGSTQSVSYTYNLTEAKEVSVVAYLGCNTSSDTKLANGIDLKIDNDSKTICDKTYSRAGFGQTGQARRTGYMMNLLGKYSLPAGSHTITIAGKNSDVFKIGAISVIGGTGNVSVTPKNIDVAVLGNDGSNLNTTPSTEGEGGDPVQTTETVIASFKANEATSAPSDIVSYTNSAGTYYKIKNDNQAIEYKFNSDVSGKVTLKALVGTKAGNAKDTNKLWYDKDKSKIKFKFEVNGTEVAITDDGTSFTDVGMDQTKIGTDTSDDSNAPVWVEFPEMTVVQGENTIKITRTAGYSLYFYEFKVVSNRG